MGFFDNVNRDESLSVDNDVIGGYSPIPTGVYKGTIEMAHTIESKSGAKGIRLVLNLSVQGKPRTYEETLYVTSRTGNTFSVNSEGVRRNLGGYDKMQSLTNLVLNEDLFKATIEQRPIKIRDQQPVLCGVLVGLLNKEISVAIFETIENGRGKLANGEYGNTNEKRFGNEIAKIFNNKGFTLNELKEGKEKPEFALEWKEKWQDKQKNNFKEVKEDSSVSSPEAQGAAIDFS